MTRINDLCDQEKPKERLLEKGAHVLSNTELLAILLNTGHFGCSSLQLASQLLSNYQTLERLRTLSIVELTAIKGIGTNKAVTLMAAFELSSRMHAERQTYLTEPIQEPQQIAEKMYGLMCGYTQEHFVVLLLNTKNQVIHQKTIFIGTLNSAIIHPREVFKEAVKWSAHAIIVVHNHPSGDPTPSEADIQTTERLVACGEAMGIGVLDHIIVGDHKYVSIMSDFEVS
ncbi:RadC family protein [Staphylococcus americanisciuri]|uniref:DNA repair protein RadC n=1 Tax=Staphylococcus americanisciuri TaxID=2973940 RepID=A0ABT2EZK9_9STAP|nr:DNA repair protein RadC [Staphylococcus americanisciuri]MCS4485644.1 DNA repair protein RadC [Staphylococcus americanisciuri]